MFTAVGLGNKTLYVGNRRGELLGQLQQNLRLAGQYKTFIEVML